MAIIQRIREVAQQVMTHPIQSFTAGLGKIEQVGKQVITHPIKSFQAGANVKIPHTNIPILAVAPMGALSRGGAIVKGAGGIARAGVAFLKKISTSPYTGVALRDVPKKFVLGTAKTLGALEIIKAGEAYASGKDYNPFTILKNLGFAAIMSANPFYGALGMGKGLIEKGIEEGEKYIPEEMPSFPTTNPPDVVFEQPPSFTQGDTTFNFPETLPSVSAGAPVGAFAPSFSIGGYQAQDYSPLLLALLAGGAGLAYFGMRKRRKKKKKKYKRKVKH